MVRVSALIPTYNRAEYVGGAIETVLAQTYDDIEAVVVNDGSTDSTTDVLAGYTDDERVRVFHNEENRGISASFDRAAREAGGELLCILGDDDRWHPEKVEKQVRKMDALPADYGVIYTGGVATKAGRVAHVFRPTWQGRIYPEILAEFGLTPHSGHMIRREAFEAVGGFDADFPRGVDWDNCIRLARKYRFAAIDELLVECAIHGGNVSHDPEGADVNAMIRAKYAEEISQHPAVARTLCARWHHVRGTTARDLGEFSAARQHYWAAFTYRPTAVLLLLVGLCLLGPRAFALARTLQQRLLDTRLRATTDRFWTRTRDRAE